MQIYKVLPLFQDNPRGTVHESWKEGIAVKIHKPENIIVTEKKSTKIWNMAEWNNKGRGALGWIARYIQKWKDGSCVQLWKWWALGHEILKRVRWRSGSQGSSFRTGIMWHTFYYEQVWHSPPPDINYGRCPCETRTVWHLWAVKCMLHKEYRNM